MIHIGYAEINSWSLKIFLNVSFVFKSVTLEFIDVKQVVTVSIGPSFFSIAVITQRKAERKLSTQ